MTEPVEHRERLIQLWINNADDDFEVMISMFEAKRYNWTLFIGHLVIEKLLKAYYLKASGNYPPQTHNLLRLAELADINPEDDFRVFLLNVTAFNISGRYDDYKESFKKKCTPEFTQKWFQLIKINRLWIKELLNQ
jgi:HEPN domain-containing protein